MRQIARYVFVSEEQPAAETAQRFEHAKTIITSWLAEKGWAGQPDFGLRDGRAGHLAHDSVAFDDECFERWTLREEINGGSFETMAGVARARDRVCVSVTLAAGHNTNQMAPLQYEARCPSAVRRLAEQPWGWRLGASPLTVTPLQFKGAGGGDAVASLLLDRERTLPVVSISTHFGLPIHREIAGRMARDPGGACDGRRSR